MSDSLFLLQAISIPFINFNLTYSPLIMLVRLDSDAVTFMILVQKD
jgi:hypothetical protein